MTTILHVASSSNMQTSVTRQIGSEVINRLKATNPNTKIIERDLVKNSIPHLSSGFLGAMFSAKADASELALSNELTEELLSSDIIVIEAPMYNFSIPSVLKAWIDHVVRVGITFRYGNQGPEGLAKSKKGILVVGRGGIYSDGVAKIMDYQEPYLRAILGFIGITDVETILIEGVAMGKEKVALALEQAKKQALNLASKAA